jgi:pantoate--beta-alanine ligase
MQIVSSRADLAAARAKLDGSTGVVMTMGALHEGHEALIKAASEQADHVIVTIFVNPLQFGPNEDFDRYPRTFQADTAICERLGVDVVFAPTVADMYPHGEPQVRLNPGPRGEILEGVSRPGFFHGVLTVVMKLLQLTRPDYAFFGEKDFQQLALITQMAADLDVPVTIVGVPTEREPDGLARSSRNRYLSAEGRVAALGLSTALQAGADAAERGASGGGVLSAVHESFGSTADRAPESLELDYAVLTGVDLGPAPAHGPARLVMAAWVGRGDGKPGTRLIDNLGVELR